MERQIYREFVRILEEELVPAMGCTEPIAVAYAAALARSVLGRCPEEILVRASANIIKNVKSVVVPNTGGLRGIAAAAAAGVAAGREEKKLEVLSEVTPEQIGEVKKLIDTLDCVVEQADNDRVFYIEVTVKGGGHTARVEIADHHTNVTAIERDGQVLRQGSDQAWEPRRAADRSLLTVERIVEFADCARIEDIQVVLQRQIDCNTAIAEEGLRGGYGARIGSILLRAYGDEVHNRAKAYAAAGSDGRMNGCELPVVINSGSGNQGLTASLPVIVYARELRATQEELYRALVVSNLVTIHLKSGIGPLSAYCGATSAGCGAGAGVTYLYGGRFYEIAHTIVNALAINTGMVCEGAKASCAAKIASAVEAGLLGMQMQRNGSQFYGGDGIVVKGVENTIRNVCQLARVGMRETDQTIIKLMMNSCV